MKKGTLRLGLKNTWWKQACAMKLYPATFTDIVWVQSASVASKALKNKKTLLFKTCAKKINKFFKYNQQCRLYLNHDILKLKIFQF